MARAAQGQNNDALEAYGESLAIRQRLAVSDPANMNWQGELAKTFNHVGYAFSASGDLSAAARAYRDSLAITEPLITGDPENAMWLDIRARSFGELGDVLLAFADIEAALEAHRSSLSIYETLAAADPTNAPWQRQLIASNVRLSNTTGNNDYDRAALAIAERMRAGGILSPDDEWMIDDLKRRAEIR
jgi:tetratricopeptide (TPR) repeat protein